MKTAKQGVVLTGDRPTGPLHLGHYVGSIQNRVRLQEEYEKCFYMLADVQALTDNAENPQKVRDNILEVTLDNLAVGVSPDRSIMFIQSQVPEIAELTVFFLNLVTLARVRRNPTVKNEMQQKGYGEDVPVGFLTYPISQAADMLFCGSTLIPVGEDQLPVIEQANEVLTRFNTTYGQTFRKIEPVLSDMPRLVGIDGNAKASKSLGNAIFLKDSKAEIERKVGMMYTDPGHVHLQDPGKVEGNVVFAYLDIFDPDKEAVAELKARYRKGGLGDVEIKKRLVGVLEDVIAPIRERREQLAKDPEAVMELLRQGTARARQVAQETMELVRQRLKIDYFD